MDVMYPTQGNLLFVLFTSLFICILVFCLAVYWYFWKLLRKYKDFPTPLRSITWLLNVFIGRYPKHLEYGSYAFSLAMAFCKHFEKEGLVFVWSLQPTLLVFGEEFVKVLLNSRSASEGRPPIYNVVSDAIGKGLFQHQGSLWSKRRKVFSQAFKFNCLKNQISDINYNARAIVDQLLEASKTSPVDVQPIFREGALKTIFATLLEIRVYDEEQRKRFSEAFKYVSRLETYIEYTVIRPWLYWKPLAKLCRKTAPKDFYMFIKDMLEEMVKSRSTKTSKNKGSEDVPYKSFADVLIENHLKDPSFTLDNIVEETESFIIAGHDTTAQTMTWCLYMLALHPEIQEKAFEEIRSVTEANDEDVSYGDLSKLNYVEAVIKETLRMYPVAPLFGRYATEAIECGKYKIPKGTSLYFNAYLLHRNPDIYPDPEKFDPERFYGNSLKKPWAYIPFAEGLRNCIGKNFAIAEMKVFLSHVLRSLKISLQDPAESLVVTWRVVLLPEKPINFILTPR